MKDLLLIDSGLPNQFLAEAMDTINYLQNRLPTTNKAIIPEESWIGTQQNLEHIQIFGRKISIHIPSEKRFKSDVHKTWNWIFLGYTDTTKYLRVWAPKTYQVLIAFEPVVNKSKRGTDLLAENPMPALPKLLRLPTGEPKPWGRPRKKRCVKNEIEQDGFANNSANMIGTVGSRNQLAQKSKTDQGGTSGKNTPTEGLVRPTQEFAKTVTETSSKMWEPKNYDEAINDPIHRNRWGEVIDEKLWNLDTYQTWYYTPLPNNQKAIGCKWVFKVKYNLDGFIERYKARLVD